MNTVAMELPHEAITAAGKEQVKRSSPRDVEFLARNNLDPFNVDADVLKAAVARSLQAESQEDITAQMLNAISWIRATSCVIANNVAEAEGIGNMPKNDRQDAFADQFDDVEARLKNREFHVGVFGEFSVGKSTFINAFIERRCLIEDVIQGTTCAQTVLRHAPKENVIVRYTDGTTRQMRGKGFFNALARIFGLLSRQLDEKSITRFLKEVTATEENALDIREVIWESPFEALKNGLVVVDTPGIGSENKRHTEVARAAAALCDGLIVLGGALSAGKYLSQDLISEVKKIAGDAADNCLFVFTHADKYNEEERPRIERNIRKRMKSAFGHVRPFWFVSAWTALQDLEKGNDGAPKENLAAFRAFRAEVFDRLVGNRQLLQCRRLADIIAVMLRERKEKLAVAKETFEAKSDELGKMLRGLDEHQWKKWQKDLDSGFLSRGGETVEAASHLIAEKLEAYEGQIYESINSCGSSSDLKNFMKNDLQNLIVASNQDIQRTIQTELLDALSAAARDVETSMIAEIRERYQDLEKLFNLSTSLQNAISGEMKPSFVSEGVQAGKDAAESLQNDNEIANLATGTGLAAGAALAFLVPGAGWLVGGALMLGGALFGALFSNLNNQKKDARDKVRELFKDIASKIDEFFNDTVPDITEKLQLQLNASFEQQQEQYAGYVTAYNTEQRYRASIFSAITTRIHGCSDALSILEKEMSRIKETMTERLALAEGDSNE